MISEFLFELSLLIGNYKLNKGFCSLWSAKLMLKMKWCLFSLPFHLNIGQRSSESSFTVASESLEYLKFRNIYGIWYNRMLITVRHQLLEGQSQWCPELLFLLSVGLWLWGLPWDWFSVQPLWPADGSVKHFYFGAPHTSPKPQNRMCLHVFLIWYNQEV